MSDLTSAMLDAARANASLSEPEDATTGLLSRAAFKAEIRQSARGGSKQHCLAIDLDHFQKVNDSFGHAIGDKVLGTVAKRIRKVVADTGFVGRTSGDEFAVFFPDSAADIDGYASKIREKVQRPYVLGGNAITITASVGAASLSDDLDDPEELLEAANIALHEAEKQRNRGELYVRAMRERVQAKTALEQDLRASVAYERAQLRQASQTDQFFVCYQPIFRLSDQKLQGFEALMRWRHPDRGLVAPGEFIPLAEETGLISDLGSWVLDTACAQAASWPRDAAGKRPYVSVNVSPYQLRPGEGFTSVVEQALVRHGLQAGELKLEITESAFVGDASVVLKEIAALGTDLSIDDFGTGYSSLTHILRFPFSTIKVDKFFVQGAHTGDESTRGAGSAAWLMRGIAAMSAGLGITTVAEGVETAQQAAIAASAGLTDVQGFLYARPMRSDDLAAYIADSTLSPTT